MFRAVPKDINSFSYTHGEHILSQVSTDNPETVAILTSFQGVSCVLKEVDGVVTAAWDFVLDVEGTDSVGDYLEKIRSGDI